MLGQAIAAHLPTLRAAAESMQTDTCTITRPGAGAGTFDKTTGVTTPPDPTTVYTGQCRVRVPSLSEQQVTAGEHTWTTQDSVLKVPIAVTGVRVDDLVEITASQLDPDLPGATFVIVAKLRGSQVTDRRFIIREATS